MSYRIYTHVFFTVLLLAAAKGLAQTKADRKVAKQLQEEITYLASDELEGRRTGSEGERKAGDYIIKRYTEEGVEPYKGQYRYPFHFVYGKQIGGATQIRIGDNVMRMNEDVFPLPFSSSKRAYSEILPDVMEQGNIWMINLYNDQDEADDPHFDCEKVMYERSKEAMTQGATGVLFYDGFGSKWAPDFNRQSEYEQVTVPVAFMRFEAYNKFIKQNDTYETYIRDHKGGLPVELNIAIEKADRTGTNIAAYIDNKAPYTVIIGAHYDHLGRGEDGSSLYAGTDKPIHNGADDNASGTAALLEIAGWIKKKGLSNYNYLFINFSGEELGLLGSKNFVKDQKIDSVHVAYMINMDMVGRLNDSTHSLTLGGVGTSPAWADVVAMQGKFKLVIDSAGIGPSDHTSFYNVGIPVLFFFTGTHSDYHKPSDDADKINYMGETEVMHYVYNVVTKMDKVNKKPAYIHTRSNANNRVNFKVTLGIMPDYAYQDGGVRVDGVSENRPAIRAGIKQGDIIIKLGPHEVKSMQSYMEALSKFAPGDKTTVTIKRDGKEMSMPIILAK